MKPISLTCQDVRLKLSRMYAALFDYSLFQLQSHSTVNLVHIDSSTSLLRMVMIE